MRRRVSRISWLSVRGTHGEELNVLLLLEWRWTHHLSIDPLLKVSGFDLPSEIWTLWPWERNRLDHLCLYLRVLLYLLERMVCCPQMES